MIGNEVLLDSAVVNIAMTTVITKQTSTQMSKTRATALPEYYAYLKDAPSTNQRPIRRRKTTTDSSRAPLLFDRDDCHMMAFAGAIEQMVQEQIEREQRERA